MRVVLIRAVLSLGLYITNISSPVTGSRHAELVKIMGPIEGLNSAVAQFEKQAFDQSEGNNVSPFRDLSVENKSCMAFYWS